MENKNREMIREELTELLQTCYNGFFAELARHTGMTPQEVEQMLEEITKAKGASRPFCNIFS